MRLFEQEPDLLAQLDPAAAAAARRQVVVDTIELPCGEWRPPLVALQRSDLGLMMLDGVVLRRVEVAGRRGAELLGEGDIVRPWRADNGGSLSVKVCERARVAILDRRFQQDIASWPLILPELLDRIAARTISLTYQLAIAQLPNLELRLLWLLWSLAQRWGRVDRHGVSLRLRLSQETIADLATARRSSVNLALRRLTERGMISQSDRSSGIRLLGEPPEVMDPLALATV